MVGAEVLGRRPVASNGMIEHTAECDTVDHSRLHAKPNDPACVLIHDDQDPVSPQGRRLATKQIDTPETVLQVPEESQPRRNRRSDSGQPRRVGQCPYPWKH